MGQVFQRSEDGGIIDPPILPEFEQRINAAISAGDQDTLNRVSEEYHQAREDEVNRIESQADDSDAADSNSDTTEGTASDQVPNGDLGDNPDPNQQAQSQGISDPNQQAQEHQ